MTTYYKGDLVRTDSGSSIQIVNTRTQTLTILSMRDKTYRTVSLKDMMGATGPLKQAKLTAKAHIALKPDRKTILGKPAQHYVGEATVAFNFPGAAAQGGMSMKIAMEYWTSESVPMPKGSNAMSALGSSSNAMFFKTPEVSKELAKIKGFPLESAMTVTTMAGKGGGMSQSMSNRAQQVTVGPISDRLFQIPTGFRKLSAPRKASGIAGVSGQRH